MEPKRVLKRITVMIVLIITVGATLTNAQQKGGGVLGTIQLKIDSVPPIGGGSYVLGHVESNGGTVE